MLFYGHHRYTINEKTHDYASNDEMCSAKLGITYDDIKIQSTEKYAVQKMISTQNTVTHPRGKGGYGTMPSLP